MCRVWTSGDFPPGKGITRPQPLEMHCPKPSWWSPASKAVQFIWGYLPTATLVPRVQKNPVPILVTHEVQGEPQIDVDWLGAPIKASFLHNMGRTFSEICETSPSFINQQTCMTCHSVGQQLSPGSNTETVEWKNSERSWKMNQILQFGTYVRLCQVMSGYNPVAKCFRWCTPWTLPRCVFCSKTAKIRCGTSDVSLICGSHVSLFLHVL